MSIGEPESRSNWDRAIIDQLIEKLGVSNGDAQGVFEANSFKVIQSWGKGLTAPQAAETIIGKVKYHDYRS